MYTSHAVVTMACAIGIALASAVPSESAVRPQQGGDPTIVVGDAFPDVVLTGSDGQPVHLAKEVGRVRVVSIVPQLNTPVCDEQTHRLSEARDRIDARIELVTISTNTAVDQAQFARKARIENVRFLSDVPARAFGKATGLLLPQYDVLQRAVLVIDAHRIVRYLQVAPIGEAPNFARALETAQRLLH
ncbi:MAG: redoxin family protein [Nitrospiraceae bacterium]